MPRTVTGEARTSAGLARAMTLGVLVFVVMALFSAVVAFAAFFTGDADIVDVVKLSGVLFFMFHHVGLHTEFPTFDPGALQGAEAAPGIALGPLDFSFTISVALLLGTLLAIVLLYRAGRRAAEEGGGTTGMRILQGAAVALPFAILSALVSLVVRFEFELGPDAAAFVGPGGLVEITAPLVTAFLWPLGIALVAGGLGGYAAARRDGVGPTPGRFGAMVSGAWRMLAALLVGGFVGLLVLGAVNPDITASYFEFVAGGRSGLILLLGTILAVPNLALWGVTMGMGGSIVAGDYLGMEAQHVASLLEFPTEIDPSLAGGSLVGGGGVAEIPTAVAPIEYFAFILLTLIALIVGGRMAAQRAGVVSAGEGLMVGAGSGVLFGIAFFGALALAGVTIGASVSQGGAGQAELVRFGPSLLMGGLLGLVWGVVAGAIGGATGAGAEAPKPRGRWPVPTPAPVPAAPGPEAALPVAAPAAEPPGPEATQEIPVEPEPTPAGGGTGFEGLAEQRSALVGPEPELEPEPEPEPIAPPETPAPPAGEPPAPQDPASEGPPAFEFTTPQAQWSDPAEEEQGQPEEAPPPGEERPEADPAASPEPSGWTPPKPEPEGEPGGWTVPSEPQPWSPAQPAPEPEEPAETPPWSDPAAFEPRPWSPDEPGEAPSGPEEQPSGPVTEPWVSEGSEETDEDESQGDEDEDEDEDEEGPAPA
ncbi:MAG TPA: DUF6350 family protein [Actinomycetota bacterium]|nr:DUF6350 family protein [Actinomycetota bacterium]